MKDIYLDGILRIFDNVHHVEQQCSLPSYTHALISENDAAAICEHLAGVLNMCDETGLQASSAHARRIYEAVAGGQATYGNVYGRLPELRSRIEDELGVRNFFYIDRPDLYGKDEPFGGDVFINFWEANYDIEEAGKCLALSRSTACVMHLMRVVEVGLTAYGTALNVMAQIKAAQPSWGDVLRVANDEIKLLNKGTDPDWTPEKRSFFENAHAHFHSVRVAWRNPTMHVENVYDEPRAEDIYNAVRSWMRHMAEHLDESGTYF